MKSVLVTIVVLVVALLPVTKAAFRSPEVIATADVIVVGSGPGGAGFLYRLTQIQPDLTILWIEKGPNVTITNWPEDLLLQNHDVLFGVPHTTVSTDGLAWNLFGGGDAGNSGSPNAIGLDRSGRSQVYPEVDVVGLRNNSITPLTPASERWLQAFEESGYTRVDALVDRSTGTDIVGQVSTIQSEDGREPRLLIAEDLRSDPTKKITYVHARIDKVLHDSSGRAIGVEGVQLNARQRAVGRSVSWMANKAVVLAGGVFGTFNMLVESGIGSERDLMIRNVPQPWWAQNEMVGQNVGDDYYVALAFVEPEEQDQLGAECKLSASTAEDNIFNLWSASATDVWLRVQSSATDLFFRLSPLIPPLGNFLNDFFRRVSVSTLSLDTEPVFSIRATAKPRLWESRSNPLNVEIDDSRMNFTSNMCDVLLSKIEVWKKFAEIFANVTFEEGSVQERARANFDLLEGVGFFENLPARTLTLQTVLNITEEDCQLNLLNAQYYHYYGGANGIIDDSYRVEGTQGLYISDASVFSRLAPGGGTTMIMQEGMRVADKVSADIIDASS